MNNSKDFYLKTKVLENKEFENYNSFLLAVNAVRLRDEFYSLLEYTLKKNFFRIVINVNITFSKIKSDIKNDKNLFCIDCITSEVEAEQIMAEAKKVHFLGYPSDLEGILKTLDNILASAGDVKKVVIIESLSTFFIYNPISDLVNFVRTIISKSDQNLKVFAITPDEKDRFVIEKLGFLFDKVAIT